MAPNYSPLYLCLTPIVASSNQPKEACLITLKRESARILVYVNRQNLCKFTLFLRNKATKAASMKAVKCRLSLLA